MPLSIDIFNKKVLSKNSNFGTFNVLLDGEVTTEVSQIIPGTNVTVSPSNGKGAVTINAATGEVSQIIAGTNVTVSPSNGKGAVTINAAAGEVSQIIAGNKITVSPSNGKGAVTVSGIPNEAFSCELTTGSTNGLVTWVLEFDTIGGFANSRFTVPAGKAGLYMFNAAIFFNLPNGNQIELGIYRNYNRVRAFYTEPFDGVQGQAQVFGVLNLNVGDIIEVKVNFFGDGSAFVRQDSGVSWFTAVRL
jgi:translation initiation factor IF-1